MLYAIGVRCPAALANKPLAIVSPPVNRRIQIVGVYAVSAAATEADLALVRTDLGTADTSSEMRPLDPLQTSGTTCSVDYGWSVDPATVAPPTLFRAPLPATAGANVSWDLSELDVFADYSPDANSRGFAVWNVGAGATGAMDVTFVCDIPDA